MFISLLTLLLWLWPLMYSSVLTYLWWIWLRVYIPFGSLAPNTVYLSGSLRKSTTSINSSLAVSIYNRRYVNLNWDQISTNVTAVFILLLLLYKSFDFLPWHCQFVFHLTILNIPLVSSASLVRYCYVSV